MPIDENLTIAKELLAAAVAANIVLEIEIGVVGGEEDGVEAEINEKLYTTPEDFEKTIEALGAGEHGHYLLAATFGNVHGVYKPGNVKLRPDILAPGSEGDNYTSSDYPDDAQRFSDFVFARRLEPLRVGDRGVAALRRGQDERRHRHAVRVHPSRRRHVVQLRRRAEDRRRGRQQEGLRPAQLHEEGQASMAERVVEACQDLHSAGRSVSAG